MPTQSLKLFVPDVAPFDQDQTWFETFIGTHILPLTEGGLFHRFWFSRYGKIAKDKHVLFRYEVGDVDVVAQQIAALERLFPNATSEDFDVIEDIGRGDRSRFLGENLRNPDHRHRGELAFDFLHAAAKLYLHCLSGPDADGRWCLERETASQHNLETSMEGYFHLFGNMTGVPLTVVLADHPDHPGGHVFSPMYFEQNKAADNRWVRHAIRRVTI